MNSAQILSALCDSTPRCLDRLPQSYGLYALWDHAGKIRYIGCTPKATEGFNVRIGNKHVTGSEGRSHKFSHAYCVGRMWRYQKRLHPIESWREQSDADAKLAKRLRTLFIREHCRATLIEIPKPSDKEYFSYLTSLEAEVKMLAPPEMKSWDGVRFSPSPEPTELVNELLDRYPALRAACERQSSIFERYVAGHA